MSQQADISKVYARYITDTANLFLRRGALPDAQALALSPCGRESLERAERELAEIEAHFAEAHRACAKALPVIRKALKSPGGVRA